MWQFKGHNADSTPNWNDIVRIISIYLQVCECGRLFSFFSSWTCTLLRKVAINAKSFRPLESAIRCNNVSELLACVHVVGKNGFARSRYAWRQELRETISRCWDLRILHLHCGSLAVGDVWFELRRQCLFESFSRWLQSVNMLNVDC